MTISEKGESIMKLEAGDLLLVRGDCYPSLFIRFFLKSSYTHVTIAVDEEHVCEVHIYEDENHEKSLFRILPL